MIARIRCPLCGSECTVQLAMDAYEPDTNAGGVWYVVDIEEECSCPNETVRDADGYVTATWGEAADAVLDQWDLSAGAAERAASYGL